MPVEIEIKLKVDNHAPMRECLRSIEAKRISEVLETNVFFDTPDRALLARDSGVRLRRCRNASAGTETLVITYKGPRNGGQVKRREEIEVAVDDFDSAIVLIERLGFAKMLSFEKRRESWTLQRGKVELDSLPQLGCFVEIECPDEAEVLAIRDRLGLAHSPIVTATYADLVSRYFAEKKTGDSFLKFSD